MPQPGRISDGWFRQKATKLNTPKRAFLSLASGCGLVLTGIVKKHPCLLTNPALLSVARAEVSLIPTHLIFRWFNHGRSSSFIVVHRSRILLFIQWAERSPQTWSNASADGLSCRQHICPYGRSNPHTLGRCTGYDIPICSWKFPRTSFLLIPTSLRTMLPTNRYRRHIRCRQIYSPEGYRLLLPTGLLELLFQPVVSQAPTKLGQRSDRRTVALWTRVKTLTSANVFRSSRDFPQIGREGDDASVIF